MEYVADPVIVEFVPFDAALLFELAELERPLVVELDNVCCEALAKVTFCVADSVLPVEDSVLAPSPCMI